MERVGDQKRIIGFSCGNQFVITPMIAFKVLSMIIIFKLSNDLIDMSFKSIGFRFIPSILFINS
jgi:hypothetical protein